MDTSARRPAVWFHRRLSFAAAGLAVVLGCGQPVARIRAAKQAAPAECRVNGRIVSAAWKDLGGGIERAIVTAWKLPEKNRVNDVSAEGERFEILLPPGDYRLDFSAVGSRGATFKPLSRKVRIAKNQPRLNIGRIDLPISKSTALYGKPAPELTGILEWQDTPPLALADLRGKVIVLDFFAFYCTICHEHKPDLAKLLEDCGPQGLVVLEVHDNSLGTMDEVHAKMEPVLKRVFDGEPPKLPLALDGAGDESVFEAYGIYGVPAVILIDSRGRVVRRYHHAGDPQLETDVRRLLRLPVKSGYRWSGR
jgi:thiol-disulfide isomerase/thioredoxin